MASTSSIRPNESISVISDPSSPPSTPLPASTMASSTRVRKNTRKAHPVWQHARKAVIGDEPRTATSGKALRTFWYCKFPGCADYSTLSTVTAKNHMESVHQVKVDDVVPSIVGQKIQKDLKHFTRLIEQKRRDEEAVAVKEGLKAAANSAVIQQALLRLIVHHNLPLSLVEWPEVHTFINAVNYTAIDSYGSAIRPPPTACSRRSKYDSSSLYSGCEARRALFTSQPTPGTHRTTRSCSRLLLTSSTAMATCGRRC